MKSEIISLETAKKIEELERKNKRLNNIINNAIEYINNNSLYEEIYDYNTDDEQELQYVSDETATNDLLNLLQGVDKE